MYRLQYFAYILIVGYTTAAGQVPEKASPFTAVRWVSDKPVVRFNDDWYQFHSINGVEVSTIINYCQKTYGSRWQKRFSEDLVEVMTSMGHTPTVKVELVLIQNRTTLKKTGTMSAENRNQVRDYNNGEDRAPTSDKPNGEFSTLSKDIHVEQFAARVNQLWEEKPAANTANLRFEFYKDGKLFSGKIEIQGDFVFHANGKTVYFQGFNPNEKGRWIYESLPPGTYDLVITGLNDFSGWTWTKKAEEVKANTNPVFRVELDRK